MGRGVSVGAGVEGGKVVEAQARVRARTRVCRLLVMMVVIHRLLKLLRWPPKTTPRVLVSRRQPRCWLIGRLTMTMMTNEWKEGACIVANGLALTAHGIADLEW